MLYVNELHILLNKTKLYGSNFNNQYKFIFLIKKKKTKF